MFIKKPHRPHRPNVETTSRVEPVTPEHEVGTVAHGTVDGFRHVKDNPETKGRATNPKGSVKIASPPKSGVQKRNRFFSGRCLSLISLPEPQAQI